MNTPTFTWAYTRTFKDKGKKERSVTRLTSEVVPMQGDAVYLNKKKKNRLRKIFKTETTSQEKLKMRYWVNLKC